MTNPYQAPQDKQPSDRNDKEELFPPENEKRRGSTTLLIIISIVTIVSILYRVLAWKHLETSSLMFVLVPAVIAILACQARPKNTSFMKRI